MKSTALSCVIGLSLFCPKMEAVNHKVHIIQNDLGQWQIIRNGEPYTVRGAGGFEQMEQLREHGGNTVRTWGIEQLEVEIDGETLLDKAERLNLAVVAGIWITHPRHGADYSDEDFLQSQRDRVRESVRQYREHPSLLMWGLGNEMEGEGDNPIVWRELEVLAQIIKEEDPDHPICTVLAGTYNNKVAKMMKHYTSLDILGINIYGGAETVDGSLAEQGWDKPYMLTEFGPIGHWEVPTTDWGAPLEPTSTAKVDSYANAHKIQFDQGRGLCLGTFCFIWGQKQETTSTWFGMFLPTGEKTPTVDAMSRIWTGVEPPNRAPLVYQLHSKLSEATVKAESTWTVSADVIDPDGDHVTFDWQVVAETNDRKFGGDFENAPPEIPDCVRENNGADAIVTAPKTPGTYRVFLFVRDGNGGGSAGNFPFRVE